MVGRKVLLMQLLALASLGLSAPAMAAELAPYRAIYSFTLVSAKPASGIVGASGAMYDEIGDACDGRTEEERSHLRLDYDGEDSVTITTTLVNWESRDGLQFRFNQRRLKDGVLDEEFKGEAHLDGPGKGGIAEFSKPEESRLTLPPGALFPMAHTRLLVERARAGEQFVAAKVFDGGAVETASPITAAIGPRLAHAAAHAGGRGKGKAPVDPLLDRPSWHMRLAYFLPDPNAEEPDYEETIRLLDNGAVSDMLLDYGDYVIHAKLDDIETLPKPRC
jgi:EipB-like